MVNHFCIALKFGHKRSASGMTDRSRAVVLPLATTFLAAACFVNLASPKAQPVCQVARHLYALVIFRSKLLRRAQHALRLTVSSAPGNNTVYAPAYAEHNFSKSTVDPDVQRLRMVHFLPDLNPPLPPPRPRVAEWVSRATTGPRVRFPGGGCGD